MSQIQPRRRPNRLLSEGSIAEDEEHLEHFDGALRRTSSQVRPAILVFLCPAENFRINVKIVIANKRLRQA